MESRDLSLLGKVNIINTLVGSLFVYRMQTTTVNDSQMFAKFNIMLAEFIWNGRRPKLRTELLQYDKD